MNLEAELNAIASKPFIIDEDFQKLDELVVSAKNHQELDYVLTYCICIYILAGVHHSDTYWNLWIQNKMKWTKTNNTELGIMALQHIKQLFQCAKLDYNENDRNKVKESILWLHHNLSEWSKSPAIQPVALLPIMCNYPGFHLTYHPTSNAEIFGLLGDFYEQFMKIFCNVPPFSPPVIKEKDRLRIGFLSKSLCYHSVGKVSVGLICGLANKFDIYIYYFGEKQNDVIRKRLDSVSKQSKVLSESVQSAVNTVREDALDVLVFLDPSHDITTYRLSCFRMAPLQVATWGHPDTSGSAMIDYYVSSSFFDHKDTQTYFREKLVSMHSLSMYYDISYCQEVLKRLHLNKQTCREIFGLSKDARIYGVMNNALKLSNEFVEMIAHIIQTDYRGVVLLTHGRSNQAMKRVLSVLEPLLTKEQIQMQIRFVPHLEETIFYHLITACDVLLDTYPVGGLITTYEGFACGRVVVSLSTMKMNGRFTSGLYKKMGIHYPVATDAADYVYKACKIANNDTLRTSLENKIAAELHTICNDMESVDEWCSFLMDVVKNE